MGMLVGSPPRITRATGSGINEGVLRLTCPDLIVRGGDDWFDVLKLVWSWGQCRLLLSLTSWFVLLCWSVVLLRLSSWGLLRGVKVCAEGESGVTCVSCCVSLAAASSLSFLGDEVGTCGGPLELCSVAGPWSLLLSVAGGACVVLTSLVGSFGVLQLAGSGSSRGGPRFLFDLAPSSSTGSSTVAVSLAFWAALLEICFLPLENVIFAVFTGI